MVTKSKGDTKKEEITRMYVFVVSNDTEFFDVCIPEKDREKALHFAREHLKSEGKSGTDIKVKGCSYCHSEEPDEDALKDIEKKGYHII